MPNKYFDTLRGGTTEAVLKDHNYDPFISDQFEALPDITPDPRSMPFYEAAGFQRDPENPNNVVTPSRAFVEHYEAKEAARQQRLQEQYEATKGSALFKIGDTLADTGRLFLSPLFWLSGEDTTKYDPSAVVDSGYKRQMAESEAIRAGLYQKLLAARDARQIQAQSVQKDYIANQKGLVDLASGTSEQSKGLYEFALRTNQMDLFNQQTPEAYEALNNQMQVAKGNAFEVGNGRIMLKPVYEKLSDIGNRFETTASKVTEAYAGYKALMESLSGANSGFADIAAVFSFMKALDPRSVVREGEFQMAAGASGMFDKLMNLGKQIENGEILPEEGRKAMKELSTRLIAHWEEGYKGLRSNYENKVRYLSKFDEDIEVFLGKRVELPEFTTKGREYPDLSGIPPYIRRPDPNNSVSTPPDPYGFDALGVGTDFTNMSDAELDAYIDRQQGALR